jgi:hypothetical protein
MALTLSPEIEERLLSAAQSRGLSPDAYLGELLTPHPAHSATPMSGEARAKAFLAWADSFPDTPPLSDEAISRASLYPDRS